MNLECLGEAPWQYTLGTCSDYVLSVYVEPHVSLGEGAGGDHRLSSVWILHLTLNCLYGIFALLCL